MDSFSLTFSNCCDPKGRKTECKNRYFSFATTEKLLTHHFHPYFVTKKKTWKVIQIHSTSARATITTTKSPFLRGDSQLVSNKKYRYFQAKFHVFPFLPCGETKQIFPIEYTCSTFMLIISSEIIFVFISRKKKRRSRNTRTHATTRTTTATTYIYVCNIYIMYQDVYQIKITCVSLDSHDNTLFYPGLSLSLSRRSMR